MTPKSITDSSLIPLRVIRTETVLSKLPIHSLAKKGSFDIQIVRRNKNEQVELRWEVSHSAKYGPPRQLAYKLDTLIVNRRIDETGRPVPRIIRLGSLRDIAKELKLGGDTNSIRKALRQNAFTGITAKLVFRSMAGAERKIEADFTRYNVVFAGEVLPDGREADSVYVVLNDPYLDVVNNAPVRPLNYDYLKELQPAAQRFYEIVSFKMFSALKNGHSYARLRYSEYCTYSPQQRYFDYDHFKKQMYKVHRSHVASGYLESVKYSESRDQEGNPDWQMMYVPGPRAKAEFATFDRSKSGHAPLEEASEAEKVDESATTGSAKPSPEPAGDLLELRRRGVSEKQAATLLKSAKPGQPVTKQLEWADYLIARSQGRIYNPPGFYVYIVKEDIRPPAPSPEDPAKPSGATAGENPPTPEDAVAERQAYQRFRDFEIDKHLASYSGAALEDLIEAKQEEIRSQFSSTRFWSPQDLAQLAKAAVRADLAHNLPLSSLEDFLKKHSS
jgi:hypothetical protein